MTLGGWFTMIISMGAFACLFIWCMFKVAASDYRRAAKKQPKKRPQ